MNFRAFRTLSALACIAGLGGINAVVHAAPSHPRADTPPCLVAQAAPPTAAASAPAAEAQPDNRETPARPAAKRRSVGVVISMSLA
jgi:hypothetical protein